MRNQIILTGILALSILTCTKQEKKLELTQDVREASCTGGRDIWFEYLEMDSLETWLALLDRVDRVEAWNWNGHEKNSALNNEYMLDGCGFLAHDAVFRSSLERDEWPELKAVLTDTGNFQGVPTCFLPHAALLFYEGKELVGEWNVCFICQSIQCVPRYDFTLSDAMEDRMKELLTLAGVEIVELEDVE